VRRARDAEEDPNYYYIAELAELWIASNSLSGTLTAYRVDKAVFDWVIENRSFRPKKPVTPDLIAEFSSAHQEHRVFPPRNLVPVP